MHLEGASESAEILKHAKTDAGCNESEKNQTTLAVIHKIESKCDLVSETAVNSEQILIKLQLRPVRPGQTLQN